MAESFFRELTPQLSKVDEIAFDIGANHGAYCKPFSHKYSLVYSFEPDHENFKKLVSNVTEKNVIHNNIAIGEVDGKTSFWRTSNAGGHTANREVAKPGTWGHNIDRPVPVDCRTLDSFVSDIRIAGDKRNIGLIKCDTEGSENFIFEHGIRTLTANKIWLFLETHKTINLIKLTQLFRDLGYTIYLEDRRPADQLDHDNHYLITNKGPAW
jgi:FkbM family methyltransferase